jgi:hypothetical protein
MNFRNKQSSSECFPFPVLRPSLNAIPSHAGERGLFDAKSSTLTFLPLSAISPDAQAVQEKYLSPIQARIDGGDCPPGLRKQYKLQLEQIKARTPSLEIALFQFNPRWLGKCDVGSPHSSTHPHQQSQILRRNMQPSGLC